MRWPLRRGKPGLDEQVETPASSAPDGGPPPRPSTPAWTTLAPISPTWSGRSPLIAPPDALRPPLTVPPPSRRAPARSEVPGADGTPEPGRVIGLAAVVRPKPAEPVDLAEPPAYFREQPPLRHATARPIAEHPTLTAATDDYVGEPYAPAARPMPAASPAPSARPAASPTTDATTDAGARFREALANLRNSGLPEYVSPSDAVGETSWRAPERPPVQPAPPLPSPAPTPAEDRPLTHRRNTLAQSRRLGLGAPIRREAEGASGDDPGGDAAADAEPARTQPPPAPPAPALPVAALPAPPPPPPPPASPASGDARPLDPRPPATDEGPGQTMHHEARQPVVTARPITGGGSHPSASTAPLVFRARPSRARQQAAAAQAVERAVVTRAPAELAQALRASHGIDVADVVVQRDTAAGVEARERRARAFTRGGRVFLPEDAGPTTSGRARGLLAHELVHAAQQRRLGTSMPDIDTPLGRQLEAEAQHVELLYSSASPEHFAEPDLVHAPPPVSAGWVDNRITQLAGPAIDYLDETQTLTGDQSDHFQSAANTAVQEALQHYQQRGGTPQNISTDQAQLQVVENDFLEIINRELESRGDAPQAQLSDRDRERVKQMLGNQASGGGMGNYQAPQGDSAFGRWQQQHLGSAMALGADAGGIGRWAELFRHHTPPEGGAQPGAGTGTGAGAGAGAGPEHHDPTRGQMFLHGLTGWNVGGQQGGTGQQGAGQQGGTGQQGAGTGQQGGTAQQGGGQQGGTEPEHGFGGFMHRMFGANAHFDADATGLARWGQLSIHGHHPADQAAGQHPADPHAAAGQSPAGQHPAAAHGAGAASAAGPAGAAHAGTHGDPNVGHLRVLTQASEEFNASKDVTVDDMDLDALALKLYDRLRSRLRRELLVDRERAGLLTDFR